MIKYWRWGFAAVAVIWAIFLGVTFGNLWIEAHTGSSSVPSEHAPERNTPEPSQSVAEQATAQLMKGYWTLAVFGVDSREGDLGTGTRSDMEMVCNINMDTGEIRLISVYRDMYARINSKNKYDKINEAYFDGGPEQAVNALGANLDLVIDDYAAFNWKAVVDAINILGGIDIDISKQEFKVINGFITETVESTGVGSHHLKQAGPNHLDGVQAVSYARLRKMDTDFKRTQRQREVAELVLEKVRQADASMLIQIATAVLPQISTSIGLKDVLPLAKSVERFHLTEAEGFPFELKDCMIGKRDCVVPITLESNVRQLHKFLFDNDEYTPSSQVVEISKEIERKTAGKKGH